jgi:HK97 family phage prohead protease
MKDVFKFKDCDISTGTLPLEIKDIDGKKGIVTGYFSSFNTLDSDGDVIKPGAFARSIKERGPKSMKPRIKHILNHDWCQPLGRLEVLQEDSKGLYYESQLGML